MSGEAFADSPLPSSFPSIAVHSSTLATKLDETNYSLWVLKFYLISVLINFSVMSTTLFPVHQNSINMVQQKSSISHQTPAST
ncbi:unnamed protein product, partial [Ilex paraguariensis]